MRAAIIDENNIVVNIIECPEDFPAPEGHMIVFSECANIGETYNPVNQEFSPCIIETIITTDMVNKERDRRIASGFPFMGLMIQTRPFDRENIAGASQLAAIAIMGGIQQGDLSWIKPGVNFSWITMDNTLLPLDAFQMVDLGKAFAAWQYEHIFSGKALKNMDPIPCDYEHDCYWPTP